MVEAEALLISMVIEGPIAFSIVRLTGWPCRGAVHAGLASAVATAVTHPQLWSAALWTYTRFPFWPGVALFEALVILVEGLLIAWMAELALPRAMLVSLIANVASCLVGLLIAG